MIYYLPFINADFEIDERAVTPTRNGFPSEFRVRIQPLSNLLRGTPEYAEPTTFVARRFAVTLPKSKSTSNRCELVLDLYVSKDIPQGPMRPDLLQKFTPEKLWWLMSYARRERTAF